MLSSKCGLCESAISAKEQTPKKIVQKWSFVQHRKGPWLLRSDPTLYPLIETNHFQHDALMNTANEMSLAPALIVVGEAVGARNADHMARHAPDPVRARLLNALPAAQRVLELGCGSGELAQMHKARHGACHWTGVDARPERLALASEHIDTLLCLDLSQARIHLLRSRFDLIVINGLEHLPKPDVVLADLQDLLEEGGTLVLRAENHARLSMINRIIEADLSSGTAADPDSIGSLDRAHPRLQSHASIYKLLMDAQWMPTLVDNEPDTPQDERVAQAAHYIADAIGVQAGCADLVHRIRHFIIRAQRIFEPIQSSDNTALFDVVVPTTNEQQLRVNVEQSPGLAEVNARIVSYRGAKNPAHALDGSMAHVLRDWVLLCHQDVYFPKGFGLRLNKLLAAIPPQERRQTLLGFIGVGVNRETQQPEPAGFILDRLHRVVHASSDAALSIDELAIVVARDSIHKIDPNIGWHLWATDLCLSAISEHRVFPKIVSLPLFHNSHTDWSLPAAFSDSTEYLLRKFPHFGDIHTLCGVLNADFVTRQRSLKA